MDRISDSGSDDLGSSPGGITDIKTKALYNRKIQGFSFFLMSVFVSIPMLIDVMAAPI